jgi:DNA-binding NtrC family response regulator
MERTMPPLTVRVLLVEDDAFQREILADVLKDEGFEVIECTTAESAELIIASTGTELQALITDHNLAGKMSGAELAQYARRRHPQMNIIIMSGKKVNHMPVNATFLQKPFTPEVLARAVRNLLDASTPADKTGASPPTPPKTPR